MEWTLSYVLSQIFSIICYLCVGITFFSKSQKNIRLLGIIANISLAINYMILNEATGWAMLIVATIRNIVFLQLDKKEYTLSYKLILFTFLLTIVVVGAISYKDIYNFLPVIAMTFYTIGVWQKNTKLYKLLSIPNNLLWITYDVTVSSFTSAIGESVMLVLSITGYIKEVKDR